MKTTLALGVSTILGLSLLACGGSVSQSDNTGGTAGTGAVAGSGGTSGSGGGVPGGSGGVGGGGMGGVGAMGGMGGIAGAGGSIACGHSYEGLNVKIEPAYGAAPTCAMGGGAETGLWEATGTVVKADGSAFVLDTCPPNADCMASMTTVVVEAPGLSFLLPMGAFAKVKYELIPGWGGCSTRISVQNVPYWGGMQNPVSSAETFYLLGVDGVIDHPDAPFAVGKLPLNCYDDGPSCGEPMDDYALTFTVAPGDPGVAVGMGQSAVLGKLSAPQPMLVHNMRSWVSGACDDYWNWGWWATPAYVK